MIPGMPETHDWGHGPRLTVLGLIQIVRILSQTKYHRCEKCGKPIKEGTKCPKCGEIISPGKAVSSDNKPPLFSLFFEKNKL